VSLDLDVDPQLADRIRRTLDTVAAGTPVPSSSASVPTVVSLDTPAGGRARWGLAAALVATAAAVVAVVALSPSTGSRLDVTPPADAPADSLSPTTTVAWPPEGVDRTSPGALQWQAVVVDALVANGLPDSVSDAFAGGPGTLASDYVALVGTHPTGEGLEVLIDLQMFAPGEYQADPEWQREVAGTANIGEVVPEGRLFLLQDSDEAHSVRRAVVVAEHGVVMVVLAMDPLPSWEQAGDLARTLAAGTTELGEGGARA
jgi:hypothetical protein